MAEKNGKSEYWVGVDVGGTKIRAGVFGSSLQMRGTSKVSTKAQRGTEAVIERIARCVRDAVDEADLTLSQVRGVGVGAPGTVDAGRGEVIYAPNLEWHDVPLQRQLEKQLGVPVLVENDCNIAALGVYVVELKSKPRHMLGIFVGTGVGGGIVLNGEIHRGAGHAAGEVGHMILDVNGPKCACGRKGCFEALASRTAMFNRIHSAVKDGQKTLLTEMLGEDLKDLRSGDLRKAVKRGDKVVQRVIDDAARYIGIGVANTVNMLNPDVVVLGGGVMEALSEVMLDTVVKTARDYAMPGAMNGVQIVASNLGDKAGITGGAVLAKRITT